MEAFARLNALAFFSAARIRFFCSAAGNFARNPDTIRENSEENSSLDIVPVDRLLVFLDKTRLPHRHSFIIIPIIGGKQRPIRGAPIIS